MIVLEDFQKIGVDWMLKIERDNEICTGGILCDDMGLGKTIQTIATILSNPPVPGAATRQTLIICPKSLVHQWGAEFMDKIKPGSRLRVHKHMGSKRASSPESLVNYDIVISSYDIIAQEFKNNKKGPVFAINWYRIVLDEAQVIKNTGTNKAVACHALEGVHRWCLTGTPFENHVGEYYSLLKFLRFPRYSDWAIFDAKVNKPLSINQQPSTDDDATKMKISNDAKNAMKILYAIQDTCCLRRTKDSFLGGKPILSNLPLKKYFRVPVTLKDVEMDIYSRLLEKDQQTVSKLLAGGVLIRYNDMLNLLMGLRQATLHTKFVKRFFKAKDVDPMDIDTDVGTDKMEIDSGQREWKSSSKIRMLLDLLANIKHERSKDNSVKSVIFSQFTSFLDLVKDALEDREIDYTTVSFFLFHFVFN